MDLITNYWATPAAQNYWAKAASFDAQQARRLAKQAAKTTKRHRNILITNNDIIV